MNHFATKCRKNNLCKSKRNEHNIDETSDSSEKEYLLIVETNENVDMEMVAQNQRARNHSWKENLCMLINRMKQKFQLDSGSTVNVGPENVYKLVTKANYQNIENSYQTLVLFYGTVKSRLVRKDLQ